MKVKPVIDLLLSERFNDSFNPYVDRCEIYDVENAPEIRLLNIKEILCKAAMEEGLTIWVGRDLGYMGGRRTGLAFTDDIHYEMHLNRWGISNNRPVKGRALSERTASTIWTIMENIDAPIFLWNIFPFHPHQSGSVLSNRMHTLHERRFGEKVLLEVVRVLSPNKVIAVGEDAFRSLSGVVDAEKLVAVRHPSYGGQNIFKDQMGKIYGM